MKSLKKFFVGLVAMLPMSAWAVSPFVIGGAVVGVGIIGVSIWRSVSPVNMKDALDFFSSCWTCQIFSDVMISMSDLLPKVYTAIAHVIIPMSATLLAIFIAWNLLSGAINNKMDSASKIMGNFGTHVFRLSVLIILLLMPLPRLITNVLVEPALVVGTSFDYVVSDNNKFSECMIATAIADPVAVSADASAYGAFSPKLRHQLTCEVANIHQITGLGMTVGWTMMNMAFNSDYMHKILAFIPIFPNIPMLFVGVLILLLYFFALLPIPLYFLEIFIKLSLDLVMLPLMLMSWIFDDENFAVFPKGGRTIRQMIDDVIKAVVGIALTVVFLTFSVMFLNAAFGSLDGTNIIQAAINNPDSNAGVKMLMDGLVMHNSSLVTVVLMGVFIAMFMTMIPQLTSMLFKVKISDKYYQTAKKDLNILWQDFNKVVFGKNVKPLFNVNSSSVSGGGGGGGTGTPGGTGSYTRIAYLESNGMQYIDTGFKPNSDTSILIDVRMLSDSESVFIGAKQGPDSFSAGTFLGRNSSAVNIKYGTFDGDADTGISLINTTIHIHIGKTGTRISDETNSTEYVFLPHAATFSNLCDMYLFALNDSGVEKTRAWCRIYSCAIFDNGTLIRNFLPVMDSSGEPCLYDTVESKFYYNKGTVRFVAGPTV